MVGPCGLMCAMAIVALRECSIEHIYQGKCRGVDFDGSLALILLCGFSQF